MALTALAGASTDVLLPYDCVVANNCVFAANGTIMRKWDSGLLNTVWGIAGPTAAVTFTNGAGALSPTVGYKWQIAFGSVLTSHISSPSSASVSTSAGVSRRYTISGNTTTDAQVDRVYIFRTIDGGSIFFEHPSSPILYTTWTASGFEDNTADSSLTTAVAPLVNQNNPPPASLNPTWFANRVFTTSNNILYYSAFEELVRGIGEESFPPVNQRKLADDITALGVGGQFLMIFTIDKIYRIFGDSLATFRFDTFATGRGCINRAAVTSFAGMCAWLDSSNTVWVTDGTKLKEISYPIRTDISSIVHASAAMTFHISGNINWLILMDGGAGKLYVYDLDTEQWMPPWSVSGITCIHSGQTAAGTRQLFLGRSQRPLVQDTGYQDEGSNYSASATIGLVDIIPEDNPSTYGALDHVELETNTVTASGLAWETDEDPSTATYNTVSSADVTDPPNRTQGASLVEKWYMIYSDPNNKGARRVSIKITWAAANSNFKLYGAALAYKEIE